MISTVIVCQNARPFIGACLESVRQQTHAAGEIIVVDGNSNDGTAEWMREQPDVVLHQQMGRGLANARNQGIATARGEYLAFLDADDVWVPQKLARQRRILQQQPTVQAVTGHLVKSDDASGRTWIAMTPGGFLFRRSVFDQFGLFDETWEVAADHAWLLRAVRGGLRYHTLPEPVLTKGMHGGNLSVLQKKRYRTELMALLRRP